MTEHKNLAEALVAFQAEAPKLVKSETAKAGSFSYKYVDLAGVLDAVGPVLAKHGLAFSSSPCYGVDGNPALTYSLMHKSGDSQGGTMPLLLQKSDSQSLGSAISYARRYALTAVLNLAADDDDGHANSQSRQHNIQATPSPDLVTAEDIKALARAAKAKGLTVAQIKQAFVECGLPRPDGPPSTLFLRVPREKAPLLVEAFTAIPAPELT